MKEKDNNISSIVFCDFDGTITAQETLEGVFKRFAPNLYAPVKQQMMSLEITIAEGVRKILESIPSARYPEIIEYARQAPIRPGFERLLDFLDDRGVPFVVVSGGLKGMVDARLGNLARRVHRIFAADVDIRGDYLKVTSDYEAGMELVAKVAVMNLFDAKQRVVIGDGATDINMAKESSLVFARDSLAAFLDQMGVSYRKWADFSDVQKALEALWQK